MGYSLEKATQTKNHVGQRITRYFVGHNPHPLWHASGHNRPITAGPTVKPHTPYLQPVISHFRSTFISISYLDLFCTTSFDLPPSLTFPHRRRHRASSPSAPTTTLFSNTTSHSTPLRPQLRQ